MNEPGRTSAPRAARFGGPVVWLILLAMVMGFGWPYLAAWATYPSAPREILRQAFLEDVARWGSVTAYDTSGVPQTLLAAQITDVARGPCSRWYDQDNQRNVGPRGGLPFGGGMALFTCIAEVTATGHGPLRAVVTLRLYTRTGPTKRPVASILPAGPFAQAELARLEARR